MVIYDVKKGWFANIEGDLLGNIMQDIFGNVTKEGDLLFSEYGVLARIEVKLIDKNNLEVITVNKKGEMSDDSILDSKRKLNIFTDKATGFDVKARKQRAQAKIKKGLA